MAAANPNNDYIVSGPPEDTVSALAFSPITAQGEFLAATSWAGSARIWKVDNTAGAVPLHEFKHNVPVLDCDWSHTGDVLYTAGCDNDAKMWDVRTGMSTIVGRHSKPIRRCVNVEHHSLLATGSWDGTVSYWDPRSPTGSSVGTVEVQNKVYAMDARGVLMVVCVADRGVLVYDVRKPMQPFQQKYSNLKYQTRAVACFPNSMGYIVASVDGKVSVDHVQESERTKDRVVKCHPDDQGTTYGINALKYHDATGTFATGSSDGHLGFWNQDTRQLATDRPFAGMPSPITALSFSSNGSLFAYAVGYDWNGGAALMQNPTQHPVNIYIHSIQDGEIRKSTSAAVNATPNGGGHRNANGGGFGQGNRGGGQGGGNRGRRGGGGGRGRRKH